MTNELSVEEAVELLKEKRMEINYQVNGTTRFSKALDMAIKAFERQEKTLSYIDRLLNQGTGKKKSLEFLKKYILEGEEE